MNNGSSFFLPGVVSYGSLSAAGSPIATEAALTETAALSTDPQDQYIIEEKAVLAALTQARLIKVTTDYFWDKAYSMRRVALPTRFPQGLLAGVSVYLGRIDPPIQIIPTRAFVESTHNFVTHLGGDYLALGFSQPGALPPFREVLREKMFTPEQLKDHSKSQLPRSLAVEGYASNDQGTMETLVLLPVDLWRKIREWFGVKGGEGGGKGESRGNGGVPGGSMGVTAGGTTYAFYNGGVVGVMGRGGEYRRVEGDSSFTSTAASHEAILRAQGRELGEEIAQPLDMEKELRQAGEAVAQAIRPYLRKLSVEKVEPPLPRKIPKQARRRLSDVRLGLVQKEADQITELERLLLKVRAGIEPWISLSSEERTRGLRRRYLRFVWMNQRGSRARFFAVDDNLLHWQMIRLLVDETILSVATEQFRPLLRGGVLGLDYDTSGRLSNIEIIDSKITLPRWDAPGQETISMSLKESKRLLAELARERRRDVSGCGYRCLGD